jgi:hypothetical protein
MISNNNNNTTKKKPISLYSEKEKATCVGLFFAIKKVGGMGNS